MPRLLTIVSVLSLASALAPALAADPPAAPARPWEPSVLETPLDGSDRCLVLTLHPSMWISVDPPSGAVLKAWNGTIDPRGGGDRTVRPGTNPTSSGGVYFTSASDGPPFAMVRKGVKAEASGTIRSFSVGDGAVTLVHEIDDGRGARLPVHQRIRASSTDGTGLLLERSFTVVGDLPPGVEDVLVVDTDGAPVSIAANPTLSRKIANAKAGLAGSAALTDAEKAAGWTVLFDGTSLDAFKTFGAKHPPEAPPAGWTLSDGAILRSGPGGDLATDGDFANFELHYEWKVAPGGNSGVMFRSTEDRNYPWETAPEMQVLDDARHGDGASPLTSAGANYALHEAPRGVAKPANEWNVAYIRAVDDGVEYWLNGVKTADYRIGSPEWKALVAKSKFSSMPDYATRDSGKIVFQDHGDPVWYRNIFVRPVDGAKSPEEVEEDREVEELKPS
jgi:hypothetical protein